MATKTQELKLDIERIGTVSAILTQPANARACYVLAHGAGADMRHAFMEKVAEDFELFGHPGGAVGHGHLG